MTALETPRLSLREITREDAPFVLALLNDPDFIRYIGDRGIRSVAQARDHIDTRMVPSYRDYGYGLLVVQRKLDSIPIGLCGLVQRDYLPDADLGFAFLPQYRSQGYAFEAAECVLRHGTHDLRMQRIAAIVQPDNQASLRLLHKLGFKLDRIFKRSAVEPEILILSFAMPV